MIKNPEIIKISVIGGDERQVHCAKHIASLGIEVSVFGFDKYTEDFGLCTKCGSAFDAVNGCDAVILPLPILGSSKEIFMPLSQFSLTSKELFESIHEGTVVLGGNPDETIQRLAQEHGHKIVNYFDREELLVANAYLTAESAVSLAISECKYSISSKPVLVLGYGRIGKILCHILKGMGADVFASARKERDFAWIRSFGYSPVNTSNICEVISDCGVVFNTIPGLVLGEETLHCLPEDCIIIDLASKPGGVDYEAAKKLGLKVVWALSLPGKHKSISAGKAVADTVLSILEDMEVIL